MRGGSNPMPCRVGGVLPRGEAISAAFEMNENEVWVFEEEILLKAEGKGIECENTKGRRWVKVKREKTGHLDLDLSGECS